METAAVGWLSGMETVAAVAEGELGAEEVVAAHLERIRRLDPRLGAFVHVDGAAAPGVGPLRGLTVAVKDSQPVAGMPWTFGSRRFRGRVAGEDAIPVARARAAGAALLGKLNLPELAAAVGTVNELFPPTHNPWRHGLTPGGSSGGSAAAVAAGLCAVAFGDDMGGSIRIPAACCGVCGLRPGTGTVPDERPDPTRLSVRGPLGRSVADLRLGLSAMTGRPAPPRARPASLRLAIATASPLPVEAAWREALERAAAALRAAGHELEEFEWRPLEVAEAYRVVRPASVSTMPGEPDEYGPAVSSLIARGRALAAREYLQGLGEGLLAARLLPALLERCDALLTPTLGRAQMAIEAVPPFLSEAWHSYTQFMLPVSFAGLPAVSLPAGLHEGLPIAVQLIGRPHQEGALLDLAEALEEADGFGFRRPPGWD